MFRRVLSTSQQALFFRRLALYTHSGLSLLHAFSVLEGTMGTRRSRELAHRCGSRLAEGMPLSDTLQRYAGSFDPLIIGLLRAGELSGSLTRSLGLVATLVAKRGAMRQKLLGLLVYPLVLCTATFGMAAFLTLYIFPKIVPLFTGLHASLPLPTQILLTVRDVTMHYWFWLLFASVASGGALYALVRIPRVRHSLSRYVVHVPLVGRLYRLQQQTRLFVSLSLLYEAGISLLVALELHQSTLTNNAYARALIALAEQVRAGGQLSTAIRAMPSLFSPVVWQLISVGEETGSLRECLQTLADICSAELEEHTRTLTTYIEPAAMVCMGGLIGFIAIALISPIYSLTSSVATV